ncbi:12487_t:CDS:2, partial [Ambispora gerdemannii]
QLSISEKKIVSVSTEIKNSSITPEQINLYTGDVSASDISDKTSNSDNIPTKEISPLNKSQPDKEETITPDPITGIEHSSTQIQKTELSTISLSQNIIDDNTDETLDFVEMKHKEHLSSNNKSSCDPESKSPNQRHETLCFTKISYNQKISEYSLEVILSESKYENRVSDIKTANNSEASAKAHIDDQLAKMIVYNEIKSLLPDITNVNLRKITSRAKNTSTISSLKDIQIQNIINDFSKTIDMSCQTQSDISSEIKVISVTNWNAYMTKQTLSETDISIISTPLILSSHISSHSVIVSGNSEDKEVESLPELR